MFGESYGCRFSFGNLAKMSYFHFRILQKKGEFCKLQSNSKSKKCCYRVLHVCPHVLLFQKMRSKKRKENE